MFLLVKRSLLFKNPKGGKGVLLHASPNPQEAPDWIRGTREFEITSGDASVVELHLAPKAAKATEAGSISKTPAKAGKEDEDEAGGLGLGDKKDKK